MLRAPVQYCDACFINIDGRNQSWRDGQALMLDETCVHDVRNDGGASV